MDRLQAARALYLKGEMHDALEAAQSACDQHPRDAEAWRLLACISRYTGMPGASDLAFRRAAELSRRLRVPHRVSQEEFEAMVGEGITNLSPDGHRRLGSAQVRVQAVPELDAIRAGEVEPDALAQRRRRPEDVLILFQVNHENRSGSEADLRKNVTRALNRA